MNFRNHMKSWNIKRSDGRLGPFSYVEVIRQLQDKCLFSNDLISSEENPKWVKISECEDFKPENLRQLLMSPNPELQNAFYKRLPRVKYESDVKAHLNKDSFEGVSVELSANGVGIILTNPRLYLGQNLFLFFTMNEALPKFNAIGTIVSKNQINDEAKYGIKFVNLNKEVREAIKDFTKVQDQQQEQAQKKAA